MGSTGEDIGGYEAMKTKIAAILILLFVGQLNARMIVKYKSGFAAPSLGATAIQVVESSEPINMDGVEYIEEDKPMKVTLRPNDPYLRTAGVHGLWGVEKIRAPGAWSYSTGAGVVVAVVDSGVDETHPDLQGACVQGWNFAQANPFPVDQFGHGTHIAGIIAARGNNGLGIIGVAPDAKIMPVRVLDHTGFGWASTVALGIMYAADNGAKVINLSLAGEYTRTLHEAVDYAIQRGCVVVAASGNESRSNYNLYPAAFPNVITVAASDPADWRVFFSNWGKVDISAPGFEILSLRAKNTDMAREPWRVVDTDYYSASGTSMAAPFASAVAALILSRNPTLSPANVQKAIQNSADDIGSRGVDNLTGYGRLNAIKSDPSADKGLKEGNSFAYPNPVRPGDKLTLHAEVGLAERVQITVYDITGARIDSKTVDSSCLKVSQGKYAYETEWDHNGLASGVYLFVARGMDANNSVKSIGKFAVIR